MYRQLDQVEKPKHIEKHPHVALQKSNSKMTKEQKENVKIWNSMVNKLREAGLMEDK